MRIFMISADSPTSNARFRKKMKIDFDLLSDEDHAVADMYGIPIQRVHPKASDYQDGFIQPAVLVYRGEESVFSFIQTPRVMNLWGASGRPSVEQILEEITPAL